MLANNEVGTLQPIADIGRRLQGRGVFFHTDAVQALGHILVDVSALHVDFLTASAHKFHGPKGCGFLFSRSASPLPQLVFGGGQEHGQRAGTENVAGVVALGAALEESIAGMGEARAKLISLAEATVHGLRAAIPGVEIQCEAVSRLSLYTPTPSSVVNASMYCTPCCRALIIASSHPVPMRAAVYQVENDRASMRL